MMECVGEGEAPARGFSQDFSGRGEDMFTGHYHFFDYKYNITGYAGQDFGGLAQYVYLAVSVILLAALLTALRKAPEERVRRIIGILGIFLTVFYLGKTTWESYYDIRQSGGFNTGLLPLDTCSIIMPAAILAGFGRGKVQRMAASWIATGGIVGGLATMLFLHAFKYYPFFSFGAFYSMIWHFLMVFMGLLILVTKRDRLRFSLVTDGFLLHFLVSVFVIPVDFIFRFDFMLYRELGGVPFFEDVASRLTERGLAFLNPMLMLILYFVAFSLIYAVASLLKKPKRAPVPVGSPRAV